MAHEDLTRQRHVEVSSDRSFGFVFAGAFAVYALWPLVRSLAPRWWAIGIAAAFALAALLRPALLAGMNRQWARLGMLLARVTSPLALGLLFFGVLTPIGWLMRLTGRDLLHLRRDAGAASYWNRREPPGPKPDSMDHQF